ncbi:uncharacterized protein UTRI_01065 [Ustilago trichophora]|uniref:Uncharacterized protein n=1 Tax=Ustilago trichophora TaxID=86804 RepID=A0A5C3DYG7_9BASI|nr:uncharacterized protein UTRI_01065 [Ustilago trichophora]
MKTLTFVLSALLIAGFAVADDPSGLGVNEQTYHDYCGKGLDSAFAYADSRACFVANFNVNHRIQNPRPSILEGVINNHKDGDKFYVVANAQFTVVPPPLQGDPLEVHVTSVTNKKKCKEEKEAEEEYRQLHNGASPAENCANVLVYHLAKDYRYLQTQITWCPGEKEPVIL